VQSQGIAQTIFGSPMEGPLVSAADANTCAPSVVRSTTFQPLP